MYLSRARREPNAQTGVEIYTSQRSDAKWSAPVKFEITSDTLSSYAHPAVSPDGQWLYFTSDMPGGYGGRDIWRINLKESSGSLENLGEWINTPATKCSPPSAATLYSIFVERASGLRRPRHIPCRTYTLGRLERDQHGHTRELVGRRLRHDFRRGRTGFLQLQPYRRQRLRPPFLFRIARAEDSDFGLGARQGRRARAQCRDTHSG